MWTRVKRKFFQLARIAPGWVVRKMPNRQFILTAAVLVGLWTGITAVILKVSVHYLQVWLVDFSAEHSWAFFVSPAVGILATFLFVKLVLNGELLRGTVHVMHAIARKSSFLPRTDVFSHVVTSALTAGFGGSVGLESPIVQTGSAIGSRFASFFRTGYRDRTLLLACGAAAGIATTFNAPIAGVVFALEVLLVDVSVNAFIPLLMAGATGALCSKIILDESILFSFKQVQLFNYRNVPFYILLGILCGLVSILYMRSFLSAEKIFKISFRHSVTRLVAGTLLLGGLILILPALFGEGYSSIHQLANLKPEKFFAGSPAYDFFIQSPWVLGMGIFVVSLVKPFAVSLTINAGGNGGNFAPSLLVGACVGFSFAFLSNTLFNTHLPVANFCLVAMAGALTGIFHAPLTSIFLIAEITGGYDLIIPLMIVAAISMSMAKYLHPKSLDQEKLGQLHGSLEFSKDARMLSGFSLRELMEKDFVPVNIDGYLRSLTDAVAHSRRNVFPVVNEEGKLEGLITLEDVREIMFNADLYDSISIRQLMQKATITIDATDEMNVIMEKFDKCGAWNIPVVDAQGAYMGFISKSRILSNYRDQLKQQ